ncbi:hypothetical protein BC567DRAFT_94575 [Phyllosticta citribraziliensis]
MTVWWTGRGGERCGAVAGEASKQGNASGLAGRQAGRQAGFGLRRDWGGGRTEAVVEWVERWMALYLFDLALAEQSLSLTEEEKGRFGIGKSRTEGCIRFLWTSVEKEGAGRASRRRRRRSWTGEPRSAKGPASPRPGARRCNWRVASSPPIRATRGLEGRRAGGASWAAAVVVVLQQSRAEQSRAEQSRAVGSGGIE